LFVRVPSDHLSALLANLQVTFSNTSTQRYLTKAHTVRNTLTARNKDVNQ